MLHNHKGSEEDNQKRGIKWKWERSGNRKIRKIVYNKRNYMKYYV